MPRRIGLLTLPLHTNYGGILQAVALYRVLGDMDKDVVFLERASSRSATSPMHRATVQTLAGLKSLPTLRQRLVTITQGKGLLSKIMPRKVAIKVLGKVDAALRIQRSDGHHPFIDRLLPQRSGKLTSTQEMADAVRRFDIEALVVGSDQVWRLDYLPRGAEEDFFFGFASSPAIRKISYAASFGHATWTYPQRTARTAALLAQFDAVSAREASGVALCASVFGRPGARHVLDPTLLVDPSFYAEMAAPAANNSKRILLSYVLDEEPDRSAIGDEVQAALGQDYLHRSLTLDAGSTTVNVPEWVRAFMDADFVVTDSFHGMVFSIIFRKNFVAIVNHNRGADRFTSLLEQLGLTDRLLFASRREVLEQIVRNPIDYVTVASKLERLQADSKQFLQQALA